MYCHDIKTDEPDWWKKHYWNKMCNADFAYWHGETDYLKNIDDPHVQLVTASVLQNQKGYGEQIQATKQLPLVYSLVSKVIPNLIVNYIAGMQAHESPNTEILYSRYDGANYKAVVDKIHSPSLSKKMKTPSDCVIKQDDIDQVALKFTQDINNEILTDIRNNVSTIKNSDQSEITKFDLMDLNRGIYQKCYRGINWMIMSFPCYRDNREVLENYLKTKKIYLYDALGDKTVLAGAKGAKFYDNTYFYNPYQLLTNYEEDEDSIKVKPAVATGDFVPLSGFITRRSKKLLVFGGHRFGKLILK